MTAKQKGYDAALTLRLPPELKEQCSSVARKTGLTTNEWIKRTLEKALTSGFADELITDEQLNTWYEQEFIIPEKTDELEKPTREEFVKLAAGVLLGTYRCRHCGALNTGDAKICCACGKEISWEHPDTEIVNRIADEYWAKHPASRSKQGYIIAAPSSFTRTGRFQILERKEDKQSGYQVVKEITPDEISLYRKIIEEERRRENR